ncbi:Uma2 family endonuclease [Desulforhabdus amnigena]|jgi:Uma2 family endonuclease|uniref:Restriction endonuclease n=1 Tax=Desulforhabdus amnigena TaxID=40218 RepID=A0A9W6CX93_9BACT|nr:Uma2 family endonuclease [Desulforhabdus amnigena]NLJ27083.1 Uma2 family endonuclease [Deltaproteobacteria bacterium]GLI33526.1 restriction endonuclease [Desulforhabdus amnigena]
MSETALKKVTYEDLYSIPENAVGEIIDGELVVTPRPSRRHTFASSALDKEIGPPYQFGRGGGPGGWIIIIEPEISLGEDILVPDLAGWKKERFPYSEETNWISVPPDWVCEVLSPGTVRTDRTRKMPIYARHGVSHLWLMDPEAEMIEVFRLESGRWALLGVFAENDRMKAEPFEEIELALNDLWLKP